MAWLDSLLHGTHAAHTILVVSLTVALGLAIGAHRVRNLGLGVAGVLFAGLLLGHFGLHVEGEVLEFIREFGLILFVFSIGLQLGPGFFASLRRSGLALNGLAALNVALGAAVCAAIALLTSTGLPAAVGLFSGATTNTPSLAAAQQALALTGAGEDALKAQGMAYALAYPFGIIGTILAMVLARHFLAPRRERTAPSGEAGPGLDNRNFEVRNPALVGQSLGSIAALARGATISRIGRGGEVSVASPGTLLQAGDVLHAVGRPAALETLRLLAGAEAAVDLRGVAGPLVNRRAIVTHREAIGTPLGQLGLQERHGVVATRLVRGALELVPEPSLRLQFGDVLMLVGAETGVAAAAADLGNSPKELDHARIGPLFLGIVIGVVVGSIPFAIPGLSTPVRLGLAGGPLIVAILLSRLGSLGPLVWYVPPNANHVIREIGIALFLACVGLKSGDRFLTTLLDGPGLTWIALGAILTFAPLLVTGFLARRILRLPHPETCGLLAGSMTDPPALAFAQQIHDGTRPAVTYATVYPLVMLLRVVGAQLLVLLLA